MSLIDRAVDHVLVFGMIGHFFREIFYYDNYCVF